MPTDQPKPNAAPEEDSDTARPLKQMLAWAMGDREMEAKALAAETAAESDMTEDEALQAAKKAIADAHSDTGILDPDAQPSSDVARPSAVVQSADQTST
jgi:hypothetical protein